MKILYFNITRFFNSNDLSNQKAPLSINVFSLPSKISNFQEINKNLTYVPTVVKPTRKTQYIVKYLKYLNDKLY